MRPEYFFCRRPDQGHDVIIGGEPIGQRRVLARHRPTAMSR
jgi:hypothetical protein